MRLRLVSKLCLLQRSSDEHPMKAAISAVRTMASCPHPRRVLLLSKSTRLEYEKATHEGMDDAQLETVLRRRGSDYNRLLLKHNQHHDYVDLVKSEFRRAGIECRVVQRFDYNAENIDWADAVFTAGGDGTFLLGASQVRNRQKPVIGLNTDPQGSEGYMCLLRKLPADHFPSALQRLLSGNFQWLFRQRIRIRVKSSGGLGPSVELHSAQLNRHPEHERFADHSVDAIWRTTGTTKRKESETREKDRADADSEAEELPVLALNEVFIGESVSSRVSYYELQLDDGPHIKQKSSGITVCTGTGSTSWYFNINKLTEQCASDLLDIIAERLHDDPNVAADICRRFNEKLIFAPDAPKMAFAVRDPVFNSTFPSTPPRGFASVLRVKSRCYDAHLVVDGGLSFKFNDGAEAEMRVHEEDALRTVVFR